MDRSTAFILPLFVFISAPLTTEGGLNSKICGPLTIQHIFTTTAWWVGKTYVIISSHYKCMFRSQLAGTHDFVLICMVDLH